MVGQSYCLVLDLVTLIRRYVLYFGQTTSLMVHAETSCTRTNTRTKPVRKTGYVLVLKKRTKQ